jgi:hypothetical protein
VLGHGELPRGGADALARAGREAGLLAERADRRVVAGAVQLADERERLVAQLVEGDDATAGEAVPGPDRADDGIVP